MPHLTAWTVQCITMHNTQPNALHWAHRDVALLSNALARPMPMHISYTLHGVSCITMQCMPHHIATSRHRDALSNDALSNALPHAMHHTWIFTMLNEQGLGQKSPPRASPGLLQHQPWEQIRLAPFSQGGPAHAHLTAWTGLCITMHSTEPNALHWAHRDVATMRSPLNALLHGNAYLPCNAWELTTSPMHWPAPCQCISPIHCMVYPA